MRLTIRTNTGNRPVGVDRSRGQAGSAALELTLLSVPLVGLLLLIAVFGCLTGARLDLATVAGQAARTASVQRDPAAADAAARELALDTLTTGAQPTCAALAVTVDLGDWRPGGAVTVTLTCQVAIGDIAPPGIGHTRSLTARAIAPLDLYRGTSLGLGTPARTFTLGASGGERR